MMVQFTLNDQYGMVITPRFLEGHISRYILLLKHVERFKCLGVYELLILSVTNVHAMKPGHLGVVIAEVSDANTVPIIIHG